MSQSKGWSRFASLISVSTAVNLSWISIERIIRLLTNVVLVAFVARHLGVDSFGLLSFSIMLVGVASLVGTLGTNRIFVRELVALEDKLLERRELLFSVIFVRQCACVLLIAFLNGFVWVIYPDKVLIVAVLSIILCFDFSECIDLYFQSRRKSKITVIAKMLAYLASSLIKVVFIYLQKSVVWFALAGLLEVICAAMLLLFFFAREVDIRAAKISFIKIQKMLSESWVEVVAGFVNLLLLRLGYIAMEHFSGNAAVATYSLAQKLAEAWYFLPAAFITALYPAIVKDQTESSYVDRIEALMTLLVLIAYGFVFVCFFLGADLVYILYGEQYMETAFLLFLLSFAGVFSVMGSVSGAHLAAKKLMKFNLLRNCVALIINVLGCIVLVPEYGAVGAAYSLVFSLFIAFFVIDACFGRTRDMFFIKFKSLMILPAAYSLFRRLQYTTKI